VTWRSVCGELRDHQLLSHAGHSNPDGLQLRSFRVPGGLQATVQLAARYKAFPGIINGGIVSTIFDCHGARRGLPILLPNLLWAADWL